MAGIRITSTESLLALETSLGLASEAIQEAHRGAEGRAGRVCAQLHALQSECSRQISHWQGCIDGADEDDNTSYFQQQLEACEARLGRIREARGRVEDAFQELQRLGGALGPLVSDTTPRARAFLRQRVQEIEEYLASKPDGGTASGAHVGTARADTPLLETGYRRSEHDKRDWLWSQLYGAVPGDLPARLSLESFVGPAADQGPRPHCVCYSLAALKHHDQLRSSGHWLQFDPEPIYGRCKVHDGNPVGDGTTIRQAFRVANHEGLLANDHRRYFVRGYARLENVDEIRHALSLGKVVMFGANISRSWSTLGRDAQVPLSARGDGGHCMLAVGYDDDRQMLRVRNSWGTDWADSGHCWVPYEYLLQDSTLDAWTSVCEKVSQKPQEEHQRTHTAPSREAWSTSNYAWFDPGDVRLEGEDGPQLEWKGIPQAVAAETLQTLLKMRPYLDLSQLKSGDHPRLEEHLAHVVDAAGERLFSATELEAVSLYLGTDAIRIDSNGRGGFMAINGRHRLYVAQQLGIPSVPVCISNPARRQLIRLMENDR